MNTNVYDESSLIVGLFISLEIGETCNLRRLQVTLRQARNESPGFRFSICFDLGLRISDFSLDRQIGHRVSEGLEHWP